MSQGTVFKAAALQALCLSPWQVCDRQKQLVC